MKKNLGWIVVSTIPGECGASVFYIQMRNKSPELENMNEDLGKVVNKQEPPKIEPGLFVAAHVQDGENKISFWTRAVVAGITKNKKDVVDVRMNYLFNIYLSTSIISLHSNLDRSSTFSYDYLLSFPNILDFS